MIFSKTYLKVPAGSVADSKRLRARLAAFYLELIGRQPHEQVTPHFIQTFERETGAIVTRGVNGPRVDDVFHKAELRDLLDAVTIMAFAASRGHSNKLRDDWIAFCKRAFQEEGLPYRVDDDGSVHYLVDTVFQETADATIAALADARFGAVLRHVNTALAELAKQEPQPASAIREMFLGLETLVKVVTTTNHDLTEKSVDQYLRPVIDRAHAAADEIEKGAAGKAVSSFADWVNACHKYRHGHNVQSPPEPSLQLTVLLLNNGLGFVRWLASITPRT